MGRKHWPDKKLFHRLKTNKTERTYWDNMHELRSRDNEYVLNRAIELTKSNNEKEKIIGIHVLAQLGSKIDNLKPHKNISLKVFFGLLKRELSEKVLENLLISIGHNNSDLSEERSAILVQFINHKNYKIRYACAFALLFIENEHSIESLIKLSDDRCSQIRNWATFGLSNIENEDKRIVDALWNRVNDSHEETRYEAILGLTKKKAPSIRKIIDREFDQGNCGSMIFECIYELKDLSYITRLETLYNNCFSDENINKDWLNDLKNAINKLRII
jgi:hypothetical protein